VALLRWAATPPSRPAERRPRPAPLTPDEDRTPAA
jgi:hypothetical protein